MPYTLNACIIIVRLRYHIACEWLFADSFDFFLTQDEAVACKKVNWTHKRVRACMYVHTLSWVPKMVRIAWCNTAGSVYTGNMHACYAQIDKDP